mmetsp:Transcript_1189/g.3041  ORF Transcript_1189/g.3041 Transcript_1189/m.3041 type:complete len:236 (-) Transcript_1189:418-1125(-)
MCKGICRLQSMRLVLAPCSSSSAAHATTAGPLESPRCASTWRGERRDTFSWLLGEAPFLRSVAATSWGLVEHRQHARMGVRLEGVACWTLEPLSIRDRTKPAEQSPSMAHMRGVSPLWLVSSMLAPPCSRIRSALSLGAALWQMMCRGVSPNSSGLSRWAFLAEQRMMRRSRTRSLCCLAATCSTLAVSPLLNSAPSSIRRLSRSGSMLRSKNSKRRLRPKVSHPLATLAPLSRR